jgi:CheY-like chemotaxis protein
MGRIAIVDDSTDILELFEVVLSGEHEVVSYTNPQKFLDDFKARRFDVVILDLIMPLMDGYAVLNRLRQLDSYVPVIATTANCMPAEIEKARAAGFLDCFTKPLADNEHFRRTVFAHVGRGRSRRTEQ